MPRWTDEDSDDERDSDDDWGDEEEEPESEDEETIPCPHCGREIHEDAFRCPYCENYISREDAPAQRKPLWIVVGVLLCLLVVYLWLRV